MLARAPIASSVDLQTASSKDPSLRNPILTQASLKTTNSNRLAPQRKKKIEAQMPASLSQQTPMLLPLERHSRSQRTQERSHKKTKTRTTQTVKSSSCSMMPMKSSPSKEISRKTPSLISLINATMQSSATA
jgi:hypothetical protein